MMKKLSAYFFMLILVSCATPQQLINQNVIYKGMDKNSLWSAMVDMNIADDITLGGCYRQYFSESQYEILSSSSQSTWYVFKEVSVPAAISNCSYKGNGKLEEVYSTYNAALSFIQNELKQPNVTKNDNKENSKKVSENPDEDRLSLIHI